MSHATGFPPLSRADARVLIVGTLPGAASLAAGQYYAHKSNRFWPIMGALFGAGADLAYEERCQRLMENGIAVWDVCASAERPGSLDSAIRPDSIVTNDFAGFFAVHPQIERICFNGNGAAALFRKRVLACPPLLPQVILPSTSPAYAALPPAGKLARWRAGLIPQSV